MVVYKNAAFWFMLMYLFLGCILAKIGYDTVVVVGSLVVCNIWAATLIIIRYIETKE